MNGGEHVVFRDRLKPCAGDLRISWRLAMLLMILSASRGKKASMAKLHVLNDACRSERSRLKLIDMMNERRPMLEWRLRVEPALSRAVDFLIGEGFAQWKAASGKMHVQLTEKGETSEKALTDGVEYEGLHEESIRFLSKNVSEAFVMALIGYGKHQT